jgi:hypothetical protein
MMGQALILLFVLLWHQFGTDAYPSVVSRKYLEHSFTPLTSETPRF